MNSTIITTVVILFTVQFFYAQEKEHPKLLTNDAKWGVETFDLPTGFAKDMTVIGFEEAIFHPNWSDIEKPGFWSYVFTWSVAAGKLLDAKELEDNLVLYFDGLVDIPKDTIIAPKLPSSVLLININKRVETSGFIGKVNLYDRFTTKKMITLNLTVEQSFCKKEQKAILIFRFSPKGIDHKTWDELNAFTLREDICSSH